MSPPAKGQYLSLHSRISFTNVPFVDPRSFTYTLPPFSQTDMCLLLIFLSFRTTSTVLSRPSTSSSSETFPRFSQIVGSVLIPILPNHQSLPPHKNHITSVMAVNSGPFTLWDRLDTNYLGYNSVVSFLRYSIFPGRLSISFWILYCLI